MNSKQCRCGGTRLIGPTNFEETFKFIGHVYFTNIEVDQCDTCELFRIKDSRRYDEIVRLAKEKIKNPSP